MNGLPKIPSGQFDFNIGGITIPIQYWQVTAIIAFVFVVVLLLAKLRRHRVDWSFKGVAFGVFFGFLLALFMEGFLIIGGRTALTSVLGWENPPPFLATALDSGKNKLVQVLGIKDQIPSSFASENVTANDAIEILQRLNPADTKTVKSVYCR